MFTSAYYFNVLPAVRRTLLAGFTLFLSTAASAQTILSVAPTTAATGNTVVISGTALNQLKSVQINGLAMRVTANSANSVSVVVPPAAASGRLRLTTANGTALSSSKLGISNRRP